MRGTLDPLTQEKIDAFASRRRWLILIRGICSVLSILLATMSGLAFLDYLFLLPDEVRYALSALAYGAAIAGAWWTCARLVWRSLDPRELARLIEHVRPDLREDLISAVELGDPHGREEWDSEEFREILQQNVSRRMQGVKIQDLLSFQKISAWVWASGGVIAVVFVMLLIPGLRYDHLLLRSLLPMANLERISRVKIAILEPNPPERPVPQGDVVSVRVEVAGPETKHVYLESFPSGKKSERVEMVLAAGRQYESGIAVGHEPVEYRIRAGDAMTRKYTLTTVPRPEAVSFKKTYVYPEYARKPNRVVPPEESGDLDELEGSTAQLEIQVNQDVTDAKLKIEQGGKTTEVPLTPGSDSRHLCAQVSLGLSGTYRVHLESRQWHFTNKFSPQYEIRSRADLVPRIVLEEPTGDLLVPPDEVIAIKGYAKDDIGLHLVTQAYKVNQGDWKEIRIAEDPPSLEVPIGRMWDIYDLRVQPGDHVATKLVAVDLKGNRAESAPVHLTISARGFDPQRLVPLAAKEALYPELVVFRDAVKEIDRHLAEAAALPAADELQRKQAMLSAGAAVEKAQQSADSIESRAKDALRVSRTGREGSDLILVARLVKRVKEDTLGVAKSELEKGALAKARQAVGAALDRAETAESTFRELLATEEAIASLNDVKDLARDQQSIHRQLAGALSIKDPKAYERLARRQGVAAVQIETVEGVLQVLATRSPDGHRQRVTQLKEALAKARGMLKDALGKSLDQALANPSHAMEREVQAALMTLHGIEQDLARRSEQARVSLDRKSSPSFTDVQETSKQIAQLAGLQAKPEKTDAARQAEKEQSESAVARWKAARIQLEARAGVEEVRKDSDPFFVSDSSLAGRALQAVLDAHTATPEAAKTLSTLGIVEKAFRTLETGHALSEISTTLREMSDGERWTASAGSRSTRHPKDWQWMDVRMGVLPDELKAAGFAPEAAEALIKNWRGPVGEAVRREMSERRLPQHVPAPEALHLERLSGDVGKALTLIAPAMEEARKALEALVPSLAERLERLSKASETIQQKTSTLADKAPQTESTQTKPEAAKLLENQQAIDRQIEEVMAELRRDANTQDLFTEKGRERARDADDAVAMLQQSPPKAEDLLNEATATPQPKAQEHALDQAAEQQGKLKDALHTLAEHYKNLAQGKPEETRPELRKAESELGLKEKLDQQYAQMERLAELAQQSPDALKAALENQLKESEAMQRELQRLTQNALDRAEAALNQASQQEQNAAHEQEAKADQQSSLAEQAKKIAEEARRMARQDVPKEQAEAQKANAPAAQPPLEQAKADLEKGANDVPQNYNNSEEAAKGLENAAQDLTKAAQDLRNAQTQENQAAQKAHEQTAQAQQNAAREQREAQKAQQQAAQAQQAAKTAEQHAAEAQKQAAAKPQDAAAQQTAQKAQQEAQQAQTAAQKAQAAAQKEAADAQAAQHAAQDAQAAQQEAQTAAQHTGQEAQHAAELAQQARALAHQFHEATQANAQHAQNEQAQVGQELQGAQADIQQAARNEQSLGEAMQAQQLGQVAQGVHEANQNQVAAAAKAAAQASPHEAAKADQGAQAAIDAQAQALAQARGQQGQPEGQTAQGTPDSNPLADAAAEFLAQALNALNAEQGQGQGHPEQGQGHPEQGQGQGQPEQGQGQGEAGQAMAAAAQAQAQAMRQGRTPGQGQQPGQNPLSNMPGQGKGASVQSGPLAEGQLPTNALLKAGDWGRLPPRLARDLMEAQREAVGGEYRHMVETYFRVIAEKAREKK